MATTKAKKSGKKSAKKYEKVDVYQTVSDKIIAMLDGGIIPWACPWTGGAYTRGSMNIEYAGGAVSHDTGKSYGFLNQMMCGFHGEWATYLQIEKEAEKQIAADRKAGTLKTVTRTFTKIDEDTGLAEKITEEVPDFHAYAHIRKGEKGTPIVFWKQTVIKETDEQTGEETVKVIPMLKQYTVFEISQCENVERKYPEEELHTVTSIIPAPVAECAMPIEKAEAVVREYESREPITIHRARKSMEAFYRPFADDITVPCMAQYGKKKAAEYYSTLFHEMGHSTGHEKRLDRFSKRVGTAAFGSENYGKEELVAEMTAAMLLATLGIDTDGTLRNNAAYIQNWTNAIKGDKKLVAQAAGQAEKAVGYILYGKAGIPAEDAETAEEI